MVLTVPSWSPRWSDFCNVACAFSRRRDASPANQDHTTSPSASGTLVSAWPPIASTASRLTSVTLAHPPLCARASGEYRLICTRQNRNIFTKGGLRDFHWFFYPPTSPSPARSSRGPAYPPSTQDGPHGNIRSIRHIQRTRGRHAEPYTAQKLMDCWWATRIVHASASPSTKPVFAAMATPGVRAHPGFVILCSPWWRTISSHAHQ